jgi:hypothetical protein
MGQYYWAEYFNIFMVEELIGAMHSLCIKQCKNVEKVCNSLCLFAQMIKHLACVRA